jgi:hypothetical protein
MNLTILESSMLSEFSVSVDSLARTKGIGVNVPGVGATTTAVAAADGSTSILPALVRSSGNNIFVSLHDVHFPAPDTTDLVSIAVVVTTGAGVGLPRPVEARHADGVEGSVAGARDAIKVNIEGKSLVLENILVIVVRVQVVIGVSSNVGSSVVSEGDRVTTNTNKRTSPVSRYNISLSSLSIFHNSDTTVIMSESSSSEKSSSVFHVCF